MILGQVAGSVYSTIHHPFYGGRKLMIVEHLGADGRLTGDYLVAVDSVGAGPGEKVVVIDEGNGARQVLDSTSGPVRSVIVGIVDQFVCEPPSN